LGAVEYAVAARDLGAVQRLPNAPRSAESTLGCIGLITRGLKQTGERSARQPARYVRCGGGWEGGREGKLGDSPPQGQGKRESKPRPTPARQSSTLPLSALDRVERKRSSPYHLVCAQQDRFGKSQSQGSRRVKVDHQLELGGLLDGKISGLGASEYLVYVLR